MHLWIIPLLPLAGAAINGLLGKRFPKALVNTIALGSTALAFAMALVGGGAVRRLAAGPDPAHRALRHLAERGPFSAEYGIYLDQLSLVMMLVVTGVGFLIHVYSVGYMEHEGGYYRYFAYLNIFMFFMLTLVLANNYLLMFVGWEGVGLASYLLIGFWFLKKSAADAGKKAFITNRVGDFGFLIALFLLIKHFGTLQYDSLWPLISKYPVESGGRGLADGDRPADAGGRDRQVGADSAVRLAAGRDGRPHAGLGPDPRGDHGDRRRVHGGALAPDLQSRARCADGGGGHRHADRDLRRVDRHRADRHQEGAGLLDHFAAGLHVHGLRRGWITSAAFST